MTCADVLKELEALGTAQNRKVYARHGVGDKMFGVSFANLAKLQRKIKTDQTIAAIESRIHASKNRQRDAMNNAVIAIGIRNSALEKKAVAAARRRGKVDVDHGETGCKTPDAVEYIERVKARKKSKGR
jgi:hypothetical protein